MTYPLSPTMPSLLSVVLFGVGISAAGVVVLPFSAQAKPQPPAALQEIFKDFNRLEGDLSKQDWKGASEGASKIKRAALSMVPEIKKYSTPAILNTLVEVTSDFSRAVDAKNLSGSLRAFLLLQGGFLRAMDVYDNNIPPLLTGFEVNIREAVELFKGGAYDAIVREIQELTVFLSQAEGDFRNKGVSATSIGDFKMLLINTKMAAEVSDPVQTQQGLEAIQDRFRIIRAFY